tara:strand:+ start:707 stop:826 length:120 start_codon:yes stop_codon:yes gene_type:complete
MLKDGKMMRTFTAMTVVLHHHRAMIVDVPQQVLGYIITI